MNLSLSFFLPESKYIELELRSEQLQGGHEVGGAPPTLVDRLWAPWSSSLARILLLFVIRYSVEFQVIPRIFVFYT